MINLDQARQRLEARLAELQARAAHVTADLRETPEADSGERAAQAEDDEALEAQAALIAGEIASVQRALDRLAGGSYGTCVACGADIAPGRLEARPEAALCIACAEARG